MPKPIVISAAAVSAEVGARLLYHARLEYLSYSLSGVRTFTGKVYINVGSGPRLVRSSRDEKKQISQDEIP
jgi:hypothetical protein